MAKGKRARGEDKAADTADTAQDETAKLARRFNTQFRFWAVCAQKACRRACGCRGDARACFARFWPLVPEEDKALIRTFIKARGRGLSVERAAAEADAEAAKLRDAQPHTKRAASSLEAHAIQDREGEKEGTQSGEAAAPCRPQARVRRL